MAWPMSVESRGPRGLRQDEKRGSQRERHSGAPSSCESRPWASTSRTTRSACFWPLRGGMYCSMPPWKSVSPTLSSLRMAENASRAHSSAAASRFERVPDPKSCEPETSAISISVSWRSST